MSDTKPRFWKPSGSSMPFWSCHTGPGFGTSRSQRCSIFEPQNSGEEPPQNPNNNDDVDDGRARFVSDPYFNLGQTGGWIGLLDTGLRFSHVQFNSPSTIAFRCDCVNGGPNCNSGPGSTRMTTAEITGLPLLPSSPAITDREMLRGVTGITLDSSRCIHQLFPMEPVPAFSTRQLFCVRSRLRWLYSTG